jgi:hypothetical protein
MKEEIESQLADKDLLSVIEVNKICNDCGKKDPLWCSINNAVLLCSQCARTHKKFNQNVSRIKSLEVDPWTKQEINFLKLGGNERFTNLIKSYNIPLTKENQEYKYYTKAAQYYRNILIEESKNNNINNIIKPSLREGIEILYKDEYSNLFNKYHNTNQQNIDINYNNANLINEKSNNNILLNNNNNFLNNNNNQLNNNNNTSWVDKIIDKLAPDIDITPKNSTINNNNINENKVGNFFDNIANNMFYAINDVKEKAKDIDFKEKIKLAGEYVQNKTEKIQNSDTFKGIVNTVSTGIDTIIQKTDQFFRPEQNRGNINNINNFQNIPSENYINNNNELNSPYVQNNNNQNININNIENLKKSQDKIKESTFKSNYSSIDNNKNEQYNNYINVLSEQMKNNNNNNNNIISQNNNVNINNNININSNGNIVNNVNTGFQEDKDSNKKEKLDNNEKSNEDNIESLDNNEENNNEEDNNEEDNNPNLLIMSNTPQNK